MGVQTWMNIVHPLTGGHATVTVRSFDRVWKELGWIPADTDQTEPADEPAAPAEEPTVTPTAAKTKGDK